jgi:hypothetical protein
MIWENKKVFYEKELWMLVVIGAKGISEGSKA